MNTQIVNLCKLKNSQDFQATLPEKLHPKHLSTTNSPISSKGLMKRLITQKIPTPKSKRVVSSGFNITFCKLSQPNRSFYKQKFRKSKDLPSNDELCYDYDQYQEFLLPFLEGPQRAENLTPDIKLLKNFTNKCENSAEKKEENNYFSYRPCGRFTHKPNHHIKFLLPQTNAKRKNSKPLIEAKFAVDGLQSSLELRKRIKK